MLTRFITFLCCTLLALTTSAQPSFAKWIVQDGDSDHDWFLNRGGLIRLANGELLQFTNRDTLGVQDKCRFVRLSPEGEPLQQWEVHAPWVNINAVIEQSDGSFACFGSKNYSALYLHLSATGTPLLAKTYDVTGMGIIAPWRWNHAVQDNVDRFTMAGEWVGSDHYGMIARIHADGSLEAHDLIRVGDDNSQIFSVERLPNGDHVFCGSTNHGNFHARTFLVRTDSVLNVQWAMAYPDSGYNYTYTKLLVLPNGQYRILLRNTDPAFNGSTLMVAVGSTGFASWAMRRLPTGSMPSMTTWPGTAHLANGDIVVGGVGDGGARFVQVLNTSGGEEELGELDIATPFWGCAGDSGTSYLGGMGFGPLGVGAYSVSLTHVDPTLDLCGTVYHSTTSEQWFPSTVPGWNSTLANVSVTDVLGDFTSYPTTAYSTVICTAMEVHGPEQHDVTLYPNPVSDFVTALGVGITRVELIDATGRAVPASVSIGASAAVVEMPGSAPGMYICRVLSASGWHQLKVYKE